MWVNMYQYYITNLDKTRIPRPRRIIKHPPRLVRQKPKVVIPYPKLDQMQRKVLLLKDGWKIIGREVKLYDDIDIL